MDCYSNINLVTLEYLHYRFSFLLMISYEYHNSLGSPMQSEEGLIIYSEMSILELFLVKLLTTTLPLLIVY